MKLPSGYAQTQGAAAPGVTMQGQGGADFAARYGWYIQAVRQNISRNWDQSTIEPGVRAARTAHAVFSFSIDRQGKIHDAKLVQTSGNSSMDMSAQRALLNIDRLPPLPGDYAGSYVNVTFEFDLGLAR